MTRAPGFLLAALLFAAPALAAEEPRGCDRFKWPLEREAAAIASPARIAVANGASRSVGPQALVLQLRPMAAADLPAAPERTAASPDAQAGYIRFAAVPPGRYQVTLSAGAWIDLVQEGRFLKPVVFSGALDCPHVRKSVRFELGPAPFVVQVSGVAEPQIALVMEPVP